MKRTHFQGLTYQTKKASTLNIGTFNGVDYTTPTFSVANNRAIDMLNFIREDSVLEKRKGFNHIKALGEEPIYNMWAFNDYLVVNQNGTLKILDKGDLSVIKTFESVVKQQKVSAFNRNNKLRILGGAKFIVLDSSLSLHYVEDIAEIPTTTRGIAPSNLEVVTDSNRETYDAMNNLTSLHINELTSGFPKYVVTITNEDGTETKEEYTTNVSNSDIVYDRAGMPLVYELDNVFTLNPNRPSDLEKCGVEIRYYANSNDDLAVEDIVITWDTDEALYSQYTSSGVSYSLVYSYAFVPEDVALDKVALSLKASEGTLNEDTKKVTISVSDNTTVAVGYGHEEELTYILNAVNDSGDIVIQSNELVKRLAVVNPANFNLSLRTDITTTSGFSLSNQTYTSSSTAGLSFSNKISIVDNDSFEYLCSLFGKSPLSSSGIRERFDIQIDVASVTLKETCFTRAQLLKAIHNGNYSLSIDSSTHVGYNPIQMQYYGNLSNVEFTQSFSSQNIASPFKAYIISETSRKARSLVYFFIPTSSTACTVIYGVVGGKVNG